MIIVIAIVSILAALLLSGFQRATAMVKETATAASMRQIHFAILAYVSDNDGSLPGPMSVGVCSVARANPLDSDSPMLGAYIGKYLGAPDTKSSNPSAMFCKALTCPALSPDIQNNTAALRGGALVPNYREWDNFYGSPGVMPPNATDNLFGGYGGATMANARQVQPRPKKLVAVTAIGRQTPILSTVDQGVLPTSPALPKNGLFDGQRLWLFLDGSIVKSATNSQVNSEMPTPP